MRFAVGLLLSLVAAGFGQEVRRAVPVETGPSLASVARFLAGVPLPSGDRLESLQKDADYKRHARTFEAMWARYNEFHFTPMRDWAARELWPRIVPGDPVIYFFGGPDAISCLALYPQASDFLLGGLEPVGTVPNPEVLDPARRLSALESLRKATDVILSFGHFITKEMKSELSASEFHGVLPVMMVFLAMSGAEVMDVSFIGVQVDGREVWQSAGPGVLPGVTITFRRFPGAAPQRMTYVQADVSDTGLKANGGVLAWAGGFGKGNVYLKAASYLMHEESFSRIRGFLLGQARSVLQDDSGIPFSFFQNGEWRCWFFGTASGTLEIFKRYRQPALDAALTSEAVPLPFGTGYKWRLGESNLLLAVRLGPQKAEPVRPGPVSAPSPALQVLQPSRGEPVEIMPPGTSDR